jgi:hypothetical protein
MSPNVDSSSVVVKVMECLADWVNKDYPMSSATILSYKDIMANSFLDDLYGLINESESFNEVMFERDEMPKCSDVMSFKGLESSCVILLVNKFDADWEIILYTAISRARLKCYIIFTSDIDRDDITKVICRI